ncbi:MAG TPA: alpha/beta hydrolase [Chloroflexia bacterium]|nr:alpha/beta hydrolase [Chloroflexia bacterium]
MYEVSLLPGISQNRIKTDRLEVAYLEAGGSANMPVVLVHGNVSCSWFFEELIIALSEAGYKVYAPDMRGYGNSETLPVNSTRGVKDFADDLFSFVQALELGKFHLMGWSLGGNICIEYATAHPETIRSLTLESPGSPFGFGGTHDTDGKPNYPDFAGCGGGAVNPDFRQRMLDKDTGDESPNSPRNVMNTFYFKPPFKVDTRSEDLFVQAMLSTKVGEDNWPGDFTPSANWPNIAPGTRGVNNTLSPGYLRQDAFANVDPKPPVLWIRGDSDQIVSDSSFFDMGYLGQLGFVPGWPGNEVFPPQPMVSQMRYLLDQYKSNGGEYAEVVLADSGHSPHIEKPEEFKQHFFSFVANR